MPIDPRTLNVGKTPTKVEGSRRCRGCGYDLDGLKTKGDCPECGKPIVSSLMKDELRFASEDYVKTLHRGALVVEAAFIALFSLFVINVGFGMIAWIYSIDTTIVDWIVTSSGVVLTGISVFGWWWLTARDPSTRAMKLRHWTRCAVIFDLIVSVANTVVGIMSNSIPGALPDVLRGANFFVFFGALIVCISYLGTIASRIPDDVLADRSTKLGRALIYGIVGSTAMVLVSAMLWASSLMIGGMFAFATFISLVTLVLAFSLFYLGLIDSFRRALKGVIIEQRAASFGILL